LSDVITSELSDRITAERLAHLRAELRRRGVDGFIVPRTDEHQGEYVPARAQRLAWLTGFTGSAGQAIVLDGCAVLFTDGRYTLQAAAETDATLFELCHSSHTPATEWLASKLKAGAVLGYDPWLHTPGEIERLSAGLARKGVVLRSLDSNPIDAVWPDQPPPPLAPVVPHEDRFTGKPSAEKRREIAAKLAEAGAGALVLSVPDSIAWLLNIRGGDVEHTPLPLSFAILTADARVKLFVDPRKPVPELGAHLGEEVTVLPPDALIPALKSLGAEGIRVQADPASAPAAVFELLKAAGAAILKETDPCQLPKAVKNEAELAGMRAAHLRDGVALTRFLAFIAAEGPTGRLGEIEAADKAEAFRREGAYFRDLSFPTISGAGANAAIVHYRASPATEKKLTAGQFYLVDSGAQYLDGTTDVTRTVALGPVSEGMRDRFTRVLKGHIAIASCRFPAGTTGQQLDCLARLALWQAGLDYDHGTGHGVGAYLSVHEGPQRISKASGANAAPLQPGMILSNEPGYYKAEDFGIRIENLLAVIPAKLPGDEREMLGFETLTLAPIDRAAILAPLLTGEEKAWLDAYHERVFRLLSPLLDAATVDWLRAATAPIGA